MRSLTHTFLVIPGGGAAGSPLDRQQRVGGEDTLAAGRRAVKPACKARGWSRPGPPTQISPLRLPPGGLLARLDGWWLSASTPTDPVISPCRAPPLDLLPGEQRDSPLRACPCGCDVSPVAVMPPWLHTYYTSCFLPPASCPLPPASCLLPPWTTPKKEPRRSGAKGSR